VSKHHFVIDAVVLSLLTPQMIGYNVYRSEDTYNVQIMIVQILQDAIAFLSAAYIEMTLLLCKQQSYCKHSDFKVAFTGFSHSLSS
jgi:hypothetical protein